MRHFQLKLRPTFRIHEKTVLLRFYLPYFFYYFSNPSTQGFKKNSHGKNSFCTFFLPILGSPLPTFKNALPPPRGYSMVDRLTKKNQLEHLTIIMVPNFRGD